MKTIVLFVFFLCFSACVAAPRRVPVLPSRAPSIAYPGTDLAVLPRSGARLLATVKIQRGEVPLALFELPSARIVLGKVEVILNESLDCRDKKLIAAEFKKLMIASGARGARSGEEAVDFKIYATCAYYGEALSRLQIRVTSTASDKGVFGDIGNLSFKDAVRVVLGRIIPLLIRQNPSTSQNRGRPFDPGIFIAPLDAVLF